MSKVLPTLLQRMIAEAGTSNEALPPYQCQAGFCGQCACTKSDLEGKFGQQEYIVEPSIPPMEGKLLPCVARELVNYFDLNEQPDALSTTNPLSHLNEQKFLFARLPTASEINTPFIVPSSKKRNHKIHIGTPSENSIIVLSDKAGPSGHRAVMLSSAGSFHKSFGQLPVSTSFNRFTKEVRRAGTYVTQEVIDDLSFQGSEAYVRTSNDEVVALEVGDFVLTNGTVLDKQEVIKLTLDVGVSEFSP